MISGKVRQALAALSLLVAGTKNGKNKLPVLCYHKIVPEQKDRPHQGAYLGIYLDCQSFEKQIAYLKQKGIRFLSSDELVEGLAKGSLPENSVMVTFDDGSYDNYLYAFPILKKYGVPAVIFLATGFIGSTEVFWWDRLEEIVFGARRKVLQFSYKGRAYSFQLGTLDARSEAFKAVDALVKDNLSDINDLLLVLREASGSEVSQLPRSAMNWDEVREMSRAGIGFGSHTVSHPRLSAITEDDARREIKDSKLAIEAELQRTVDLFAYPYGGEEDVPPFAPELLRELNFKAGFTTVQGPASIKDDPMLLPRIALSGMDDFTVFKAKLFTRYFSLIKMIKRARKALLCVFR